MASIPGVVLEINYTNTRSYEILCMKLLFQWKTLILAPLTSNTILILRAPSAMESSKTKLQYQSSIPELEGYTPLWNFDFRKFLR